MKTLQRISILAILLISSTSCIFDNFGIQGNRNVVSEHRNISPDFEAIKVSHGIKVFVKQGENVDLMVEADENIIDLLITEIKDGELKIYFEKNVNRAKARNVFVTVNQLASVKTSSGSSVKLEQILKTKSIRLKATSGSEIQTDLDAQEVTCSTTSGAHINLRGKADFFHGESSSGSHINARDLRTKNCDLKVSSGARITIYAIDKLSAKASSGGNIYYYGEPDQVNKSKSSGGNISQK